MTPDSLPPDATGPAGIMPTPADIPPPEKYPFWGYLDVLGFVVIALLGSLIISLLSAALIDVTHAKKTFILFPAQVVLYGFLLATLAVMFRRYYGRPLWRSLRWVPAKWSGPVVAACGVLAAFAVVIASLLMHVPDIDSPMKALLSDPGSMLMIAVLATTLAPVCEEVVFRGFLQPLLVRSLGAAPGILLAAVAFGLLHLQEYGYSWRHALLIAAAGAAFGWMRHHTGSTRAAAMMHAAYNCVFFVLLAVQQVAVEGRWAEHGK